MIRAWLAIGLLAASAHAQEIPGYSAAVMPCRIVADGFDEKTNTAYMHTVVLCEHKELDGKSLRELSVLRNTIYARLGWDGYRKPWLRDHFHTQAWFKPNPKFSYKQLSEADKKNAHFIAVREQSFTDVELRRMRDDIFAHHGKVWSEKPSWTLKNGKEVRSCKRPRSTMDDEGDPANPDDWPACHYPAQSWYKPDPKFSESSLTGEEKIELGLIARAMGEFALDDESRGKSEKTLDRLLKPEELRQLSLRDLRLLRNTIYAKRGRPFKSEILQGHFKGMEWYKVRDDYSDKLLTQTDTRNIQLIKSVENEFGGPLSDEDWLTEPATDGA